MASKQSWISRIHPLIKTPLSPDEMIVASNKYGVAEIVKSQYETKMTIIVRNFQKEDVGSYRCIAKNSLGEVDSSIRLYGKLMVYIILSFP